METIYHAYISHALVILLHNDKYTSKESCFPYFYGYIESSEDRNSYAKKNIIIYSQFKFIKSYILKYFR